MQNKFINLLNYYKDRQNFVKCNSLLKKEIIYIYTLKVKEYNKNYCYSTTVELLEEIQKYLSTQECIPYIRFYNALNEDCLDYEKTDLLFNIYLSILDLYNTEKISIN